MKSGAFGRTAAALISIVMVAMVSPLNAVEQSAYTSRVAFNEAVAGYSIKHTVSFDDKINGEYAGSYGKMLLWANGLDSDGSTYIGMSPIATSVYSPTSSPNTLGVDTGNQLLSGNSDTITFYFSGPVNAFGMYLIGNPSPTGDPAIPFWKLQANTATPFDALSATDPIDTLSQGNDRYFLGIKSSEPFTQVTLYSDNDPAAVFSFNVDDIVYATDAQPVTISQIKGLPQGTVVKLIDARVARAYTSMSNSRFYVGNDQGSTGIAVFGNGPARGTAVELSGIVTKTSDDEVAITLDEILSQSSSTAPRTWGMTTLALGGGVDKDNQIGIPGSTGPNNIGLDVKIAGKITEVHLDYNPYGPGSWIVVDDGVARTYGGSDTVTGVRVMGAVGADHRNVGDFVVIKGSSSLWKHTDGSHYPLVRVAQSSDISPE